MRVENRQVELLEDHLQRLKVACKRLHIENVEWQRVESQAKLLANELENGVLKIVISRGQSSRGYGTNGVEEPTAMFYSGNLPTFYLAWRQTGISLGVAQTKLARQPLLAGLKHLNRLEQVLVKRELEASNFDDLLVLDTDENLVETSIANLFWLDASGAWNTPNLDFAGIDGVMRNHILEKLHKIGSDTCSGFSPIDDLKHAKGVFICNSLMGIVPVRQIELDDEPLVFPITPVTALQKEFK